MTVNELTKSEKIAFLEMMAVIVGEDYHSSGDPFYRGLCSAYDHCCHIWDIDYMDDNRTVCAEVAAFFGIHEPKKALWFPKNWTGTLQRLYLIEGAIFKIDTSKP